MEPTQEQANEERTDETVGNEIVGNERPVDPDFDASRIAQMLQVRRTQVEKVARLLADGHEPAFIARHRRDLTLGLPEEAVWRIHDLIAKQKAQAGRRREIIASLTAQGKLSGLLEEAINEAEHPRRLEDIQAPLRPRRRSISAPFRDKGLGNLAEAIWLADPVLPDGTSLESLVQDLADPERGIGTADEIRDGLKLILAEVVADAPDIRSGLRHMIWETARVRSGRNPGVNEAVASEHKEYWQFSDTIKQIPAHRVLGLARAERSGAVGVSLEWDRDAAMALLLARMPLPGPEETVAPSYSGEASGSFIPEKPQVAVAVAATEVIEPEVAEVATVAEEVVVAATEAEATPVVDAEAALATEVTASEAVSTEAAEVPLALGGESAPAVVAPAVPTPPRHAPTFPVAARFHRLERPELLANHPHAAFLNEVARVALEKVLIPIVERDIRRDLTTRAEEQAAVVQERNLRVRLMTPPMSGRKVLGVDPTFRHGFRVAVIDEAGKPLEYATLHPQGGVVHVEHAKRKLEELLRRFEVELVAVGGGSASRQAEELVATVLRDLRIRREKGPEVLAAEAALEAEAAQAAQAALVAEAAAHEAEPVAEAVTEPVAEAVTEPVAEAGAEAIAETVEAPEGEPVATEATAGEAAAVDATVVPSTEAVTPAVQHGGRKGKAKQPKKEPPPPEVVNLDGLPEASANLAYAVMPDPGAPLPGMEPEELRGIDGGLKAAVSVARMLQDPLRELLRFDPMNMAPGMHQVELNPRQWRDTLGRVVRSCVCEVGLDLNQANAAELTHVAGLNPLVAQEIVAWRARLAGGRFDNRPQLLEVPGIDEYRWTQAAAFLRVLGGSEPLDSTWVHPEQYPLARKVLELAGLSPSDLADESKVDEVTAKLRGLDIPAASQAARAAVQAGELQGPPPSEGVVADVVGALIEPGRDPRRHLRPLILRGHALTLEDLKPGQELEGRVLNVVDFGCFVDIGLREGGLVHISQMATRYIRNPYEVVRVGEPVRVWVLNADTAKGRVSLSMLEPGQEAQGRGEQGRRGRGDGPRGRGDGPGRPQGGNRGRRGPGRPEGAGAVGEAGAPMREGGLQGGPREGGPREGGPREGGQRDGGRFNRPSGPRPDSRGPRPEGGRPEGRPEGARGPGGPGRPGAGRPGGRPGMSGPGGPGGKPGSSLPPRGSSRKEMDSRGNRPRPGQGGGGYGGTGAPRPVEEAAASDAAKIPQAKPIAKPQKPAAKPVTLSKELLGGASPLGSFAELAAYLAATDKGNAGPETGSKGGNSPESGEGSAQ